MWLPCIDCLMVALLPAQLACPPLPEAIHPLLPPAQHPMRLPHHHSALSVQWCPHAGGPGRYPLTTKPTSPTSCPFDSPESPPMRPARPMQPPSCTTHTTKSWPMAPTPYSLRLPLPFSFQWSPLHLTSKEARCTACTCNSFPKRPASWPHPWPAAWGLLPSPNLLPTSKEAHATHSHSLANMRDDCVQCQVGHLFLYLLFYCTYVSECVRQIRCDKVNQVW